MPASLRQHLSDWRDAISHGYPSTIIETLRRGIVEPAADAQAARPHMQAKRRAAETDEVLLLREILQSNRNLEASVS